MLVEADPAEGGLAGAAVIEEQGARLGQARPGGRERGIGGGGPLEVLDRRAEVVGGAVAQVLLAFGEGLRRRGGRLRGRGHGDQQRTSCLEDDLSHCEQYSAMEAARSKRRDRSGAIEA